MNGASLVRNAVVGGDRCAHALRTVLREALYILARCERRVREQQARGLCALTAAAVPADFDHVFHAVSSCVLCYPCRNNKKRAFIPVKGRKLVKLALRLTTRYCVPAYAASITAKLPSAPTVSEKSSGCNSGVIFGSALLAPGLHHTPARFAFGIRNVLSPSSSFVDEIVSYAHFPPFFVRCASLYIIIGKCP